MVTEDGEEKGLVDFSDGVAVRTADAEFVGWQWLCLQATLRSLLILCPQLYGLFLLKTVWPFPAEDCMAFSC